MISIQTSPKQTSAGQTSARHTSSETDLTNAICHKTIFADINLRRVKGITNIRHKGPSRLTLHTLYLTQDGSTLHFLRGTGVSDEWIDFYRCTMMG